MKHSEDPKKPTPKELEAADQFAKRFSLRKGLIFGENAHIGNTIPQFVDTMGNVLPKDNGGLKLPSNTVMDIRQLPSYVTADNLVVGKDGLSYFEDQNGDFKPIHPDILRSSRFNPMRGKPMEQQALASNIFNRTFQ